MGAAEERRVYDEQGHRDRRSSCGSHCELRLGGHREVTWWIGREDWGRGIATRALQEFLQLEATRPLYARAASDNAASIRVLTKCGFLIVGEGADSLMGATRKRTRSCSDSMHDPNCPRLGQRAE